MKSKIGIDEMLSKFDEYARERIKEDAENLVGNLTSKQNAQYLSACLEMFLDELDLEFLGAAYLESSGRCKGE